MGIGSQTGVRISEAPLHTIYQLTVYSHINGSTSTCGEVTDILVSENFYYWNFKHKISPNSLSLTWNSSTWIQYFRFSYFCTWFISDFVLKQMNSFYVFLNLYMYYEFKSIQKNLLLFLNLFNYFTTS